MANAERHDAQQQDDGMLRRTLRERSEHGAYAPGTASRGGGAPRH